MYYVYILKSVHFDKTYVGMTDDIPRRLSEHNFGYNTFTKRFKPWTIAYKECVSDRVQAHKREKYYKSGAGRRWIRNNLFNNAGVAKLVDAQP